jgi:mono/diheme cytochrome c family protein
VIRPILILALFFAPLCTNAQHDKSKAKPATTSANTAAGRETFLKYCASCHGTTGKGDGPAAFAMKRPPRDLTAVAKRHEGKFPEGYIGALLKFGRNLAAHGSDECQSGALTFEV